MLQRHPERLNRMGTAAVSGRGHRLPEHVPYLR